MVDELPILDLLQAHKHSSRHYEELMASEVCGCFFCGETFPPSEIQEWVQGQMAICPRCHIDSVLGSASGYPLHKKFLDAMHRQWFGRANAITIKA